jgi:hypothetical protein
MFQIVPPSITYSITDKLTWSVWTADISQNSSFDILSKPVVIPDVFIESGNFVPTSFASKLQVEAVLGFPLTNAIYKVHSRRLSYPIKHNKHLLKLESATSNYGKTIPNENVFYYVINPPSKQLSENWIFLYRQF